MLAKAIIEHKPDALTATTFLRVHPLVFENCQQHFLFAKTKKVFQVITLTIGFINILGTQLLALLSMARSHIGRLQVPS